MLSFLVEKKSDAGAAVDTSFKITSKVPVTESDLKQSLRIVSAEASAPPVDYDLQSAGQGEYRAVPKGQLAPGTVYKVVISAGVQSDQGISQRDFSWALQTQNVFKVLESVPGDKTTGVPLDSVVEFTMSQTNWEDPATHFNIEPSVKGRFEAHGRTLVFLPDKPLAPSTLYKAVLKSGLAVKGSDLKLEQDYMVRFETIAQNQKQMDTYFMPNATDQSVPGKDMKIFVDASENLNGSKIKVTGYSVSADQFKNLFTKLNSIPLWASEARDRFAGYSEVATSQAFSVETEIKSAENDWRKFLLLPSDIGSGFYVIKYEVQGKTVWSLMQRSGVAAYAMADRSQVVVWSVNSVTGKPAADAKASANGQEYSADGQGILRAPTPEAWAKAAESGDDSQVDPLVFEITSGPEKLFLNVAFSTPYGMFYYSAGQQADLQYWSYIFPDRPIYRPQDKVQVFGVMKDRKTGEPAGKIRLELQSVLMDWGTFQQKVYAYVDLETDKDGFYKGELNWPGQLKQGYYQIVLKKDNSVASSRSIQVTSEVKPAYTISIMPDNTTVYAGDKVTGKVSVKFFDGTPFAKTKVNLNAYGAFGLTQNFDVTTDDGGYADFSIQTNKPKCDLESEYPNCQPVDYMTIEAKPALGEEADITAYANISVWRGHEQITSEMQKEDNGNIMIPLRVREIRLDKVNGREPDSVVGNGIPNVKVSSRVLEQLWDQIQVGTYYDAIQKKSVPHYDYKKREVQVGVFEATTDGQGNAQIKFPYKDNTSYKIISWTTESDGTTQATVTYASHGWYSSVPDMSINLQAINPDQANNTQSVGDTVAIAFMQANKKLSSDNSSFLFSNVYRGIQSMTVSSDPSYSITLTQDEAPSMTIYGVAYTPDGFTDSRYSIWFDSKDRELKIELQADQPSYSPREKVKLKAKVTTKGGSPISNTRVAVSVSDEALLSLARYDSTEDPLATLHHSTPDGIITTAMSRSLSPMYGGGGAERGGGGEQNSIRNKFQDQPAFVVLQTDWQGNATTEFEVPDNITSWRVTGVAISPDLLASSAVLKVPVTKPIFVDAVIPNNLLTTDKPVMKLRAFGTGLPKEGIVKYQIDIPSLGVSNQMIEGQVNAPVYLAMDKLVAGDHKATIRATINNQTDAIEKTIHIVDSHASHEERVSTELAPGTTLPDIGLSTEVQVAIESKARAAKRSATEALAQPWSARLESLVAGNVARNLLKDYFQEDGQWDALPAVQSYQKDSGGLSILPYSSESVSLSSKAASIASNLFDPKDLANYFWKITDNSKSAREESIQALSGLAALGEPVLDRLQTASNQKDLTWREKLALIRGLDAAGDRENARVLLQSMLDKAILNDQVMRLNVSQDKKDEIEATSEAAALAAVMALPQANQLAAYVESNWSDQAMADLDRAMYLQAKVPTLPVVDVQVSYAIDQDVKNLNLKDEPWQNLTLTADEVSKFKILSANGPATASFLKRVAGQVPQNSALLGITRTYSSATSLHEGDSVNTKLTMNWDSKAQDGCYIVRDRLPATFVPLVSVGNYYDMLSPVEADNGEVAFTACKDVKPQTIEYKSRVVSLGTYTAEGALIQSMDTPSLANTSAPQIVEVK